MKNPPIILSVAGSDSSGGAGIQADIKTISALGGYACTVVTAITAQNTRQVSRAAYLPGTLVSDQLKAVFTDLEVSAVKVGMTGRYEIIKAIGYMLIKNRGIPVVVDPVMMSTTGRKLADDKSIDALKLILLPQCKLATPNLLEASVLLGKPVSTPDDMKQAAIALWQQYKCAFLLKGGHMDGSEESLDVLFDGQLHYFTAPRIDTPNTHGTGCTLSAAIATYIGMGMDLVEAINQAKDYLGRALLAGKNLHVGHGSGPVWHSVDHFPLQADGQ